MSRFSQIFSEDKPGRIPHPSDIGLDMLSEEIFRFIPHLRIANEKISRDRVRRKIDGWLHGFETNPEVIAGRQDVTRYALENPGFVRVVDHLAVYPNQSSDRDDNFTRFTGMMRRFDTFAESVSCLRNNLSAGELPPPLRKLLHECEAAEEDVREAKRHLDPEFDLRIEWD